jgi:catalase
MRGFGVNTYVWKNAQGVRRLVKYHWIPLEGEQYLADRIAAAEVRMGKGRVILYGFAVQLRAQPHGTFKLLFNAIHTAGAAE